MSGVIQVEGQTQPALHPHLGVISTDASLRRDLRDFPAVAWFTTQTKVPRTLIKSHLEFRDEKTGELRHRYEVNRIESNMIALQRVALGFPVHLPQIVRWVDYYGFATNEGREINETAQEAGDNPSDWYISETQLDMLEVCEFWYAPKISDIRLQKMDKYIDDIRKMVAHCRTNKGTFIPPSWLTTQQAEELARKLQLPVGAL